MIWQRFIVALQQNLMKIMAQNIISKCVWIVDTIYRAGKISFEELNERWVHDEISEGAELSKRTFDNWKYAIQDIFGLYIENERKGKYRYYIMNEEDIRENGIRSWLYNTFCVGNTLMGCQSIKDRILLENVPSGKAYLQTVIGALKENRVLNLTYRSYWKAGEVCLEVEPFCIKLFRQRWYLVARDVCSVQLKDPKIYSFDRMTSVRMTNRTFTMPEHWSPREYFEGCFGIIAGDGIEAQTVKLKVHAGQANYIRDLKLHESQQEIERTEDYSIFSCFLRPTFDFQQELLRHGDCMEVLEPLWLRKELAGRIKRMWNIYHMDK